MKLQPHILIPYLLVIAGILSIAWWITKDPVKDLVESVPGMDNRGEGVAVNLDINIGGFYEEFNSRSNGRTENELTETWPRFRGEHFDNISRSDVSLIDAFPEEGPEIIWSPHLGEGIDQ